jgi:hypothetical protein
MYVPAGVLYIMVATGRLRYVFCYAIVLTFFFVCEVSVSLIHLLLPACIL